MRLGRALAALLLLPLLLGVLTAPADAGGDPRWVFYTNEKTRYTSPWYAGAHRIMVRYGCTPAPYYDPDPRCAHDRGFHHGIDIAMKCGTPLYARFRGRVVSHESLGPAYGTNPMLIRNRHRGYDLVIGHTRKVFAHPGDRVRRGEKIALVSDNGAPDGCHLHFERRAVGGGLDSAVLPRRLLKLTAKEKS
ncbi:M23 family metallopeptidase [Nocardioides sp. MAHUQ-72]|uniref:M23 family metallopeptidase n=1 Tax=unclassified Nocardioides TaxID=2615069 RepID=UPI0036231F0C